MMWILFVHWAQTFFESITKRNETPAGLWSKYVHQLKQSFENEIDHSHLCIRRFLQRLFWKLVFPFMHWLRLRRTFFDSHRAWAIHSIITAFQRPASCGVDATSWSRFYWHSIKTFFHFLNDEHLFSSQHYLAALNVTAIIIAYSPFCSSSNFTVSILTT